MKKTVGIGIQDFLEIRQAEYFYIDKTAFIKEWWESGDRVTLITRPRRFGKTLNMNMLECFFSIKYKDRADLFDGLDIWKEEKYRELQGTYPVIFLSFADVKQGNYNDAVKKIKNILSKLYDERYYLADWEGLTPNERKQFLSVGTDMDDVTAQDALKNLSDYLSRYYQKKVLIFLDEYDTPMQEAYLGGYWEEFTEFIRSMFNATFKTNPSLERGIMTGITRVSKESIFSDLNNLKVITTTSNKYATCFGFTEKEVFNSLDNLGLSERKQDVKEWYDGFTFGTQEDIYNPWSITNFLDERKLQAYWASTSSNGLINMLLQSSSSNVKKKMELLIKGDMIQVIIDEQIIFNQLDEDEDAIWSLMLASGYLKVDKVKYQDEYGEELDEPVHSLSITNKEVRSMFVKMFKGWFKMTSSNYNGFVSALLKGNVKEMNIYMNEVALATFSSFDTGKHPSQKTQPERFYHGFVLGLLVELRGKYEVLSNGESGYGRYDVMLYPLKENEPAIVLEFKVHDADEEKTLKDTVAAALLQIEEMQYDTKLLERGIKPENIQHYGFAFEGKKVLIG
ncbi:MAG: AAA family ATPase [Lachnospiraceae bacterium]|nr:AAA family ATPase [Lachnospiraceae bacterium]